MTTTTHKFAADCPSETLGTPEQLSSAAVTYEILATSLCTDGHSTHLFYGTHDRIRVTDLDVPGDTFVMTIRWRPGVEEQIVLSPNSGVAKSDDRIGGKTTLTFDVPTASQGTSSWIVSGGVPGFKLTVKVRRKS